MTDNNICSYCDGKGYVEIRDCTGEVQREETCMLCGGLGENNRQQQISLTQNLTNYSHKSTEK